MSSVMPNGIWHHILASQGQGNSVTLNHWQAMVQMPNGIWHQILASQGQGNSVTLNHWQAMVQRDAKSQNLILENLCWKNKGHRFCNQPYHQNRLFTSWHS
jgi:hypothetical protein